MGIWGHRRDPEAVSVNDAGVVRERTTFGANRPNESTSRWASTGRPASTSVWVATEGPISAPENPVAASRFVPTPGCIESALELAAGSFVTTGIGATTVSEPWIKSSWWGTWVPAGATFVPATLSAESTRGQGLATLGILAKSTFKPPHGLSKVGWRRMISDRSWAPAFGWSYEKGKMVSSNTMSQEI
jgi:hypothetical protein